mgnify:CR=1 FL=1
MNRQSRRHFIQSCFYLALSGFFLFPAISAASSGKTAKKARIDPSFEPAYLKLHRNGELKKRGDALWGMMESCRLCPRECGVNRLAGAKGFCQGTASLMVSSFHPHFGEERPLVGKGGSGTVFFSNCNLRCVFCINWQISQGGMGESKSIEQLAAMMIHLQDIGCHNINVVTPTHYSPHILLAVDHAAGKGLRLPVVYNTSGWEKMDILEKLDGVIDIYLPDFKYADAAMADKFSLGAGTYPEVTKKALLEMHRQVGVAKPARDGLMYRGLMIRHLVMPNHVSGTKAVMEWISDNLPKDTYMNIMSQYRPAYKASQFPEISRGLTVKEYREAVEWAKKANLVNLDLQGM